MDIDKLKTELETDPQGLGYSGMNDKAASVAINEANRSYVVPLSSRQMLEWAMQGGRLSGMNDATTTGTNERAKNIHRRHCNDRLCGCWSSLTVA